MTGCADLDQEGVWGEVMYASIGLWESTLIRIPSWCARSRAPRTSGWRRRSREVGADRLVPHRVSAAARRRRRGRRGAARRRGRPARSSASPPGMPDGVPRPATTTTGSRCGRRARTPAWCSAFHIGTDGGDDSRGRCTAAPAAPSSTTSRPPTAASGSATKMVSSRRPRPAPRPQGAHLRGRRDVGAVPRRPHERGATASTACSCGRTLSQPAEGDPLPAGVRVVPARRVRAGRALGDGLPQRDVGQRLPAPRGHATATPRRRCTSCSTTSTPDVSHRIRIGAFHELFPHVSDPPGESS